MLKSHHFFPYINSHKTYTKTKNNKTAKGYFIKEEIHTRLKVGKRNIKTALAVFISMIISKVFKLEYPFFAVIAAIFAMENSISNSYKAGLYRILGTVIGAFVGVIFVSINPGNSLLMGIGTFLLIFICNSFRINRAIPIAGVVFSSIMLSLNNKNPLQYSISRVLDTFVGIAVAVAVNLLIFKPDTLTEIRKNLNTLSVKLSTIVIESICQRKSIDLNIFRNEVIDSIKYLEEYKMEFKLKTISHTELSGINNKLELLRGILAYMKIVVELMPHCSLNPENIDRLRLQNLCNINTGEFTENKLNIIYNYHVGKILDILPNLVPGK